MGVAGKFPYRFMGAIMIGQAIGGVTPPIINIIICKTYFLDMFLIYKDPKSAEKLSFPLEFLVFSLSFEFLSFFT